MIAAQRRNTFGLRESVPARQRGQRPTTSWLRLAVIAAALSFAGFVVISLLSGNTTFYYHVSFSGPADVSQQLDWCSGKDNPAAEQIISGCTALIDSGKGNAKGLSEAAFNRGNAYASIGDRDHAIADYSEAIKLDPAMAPAFDSRGRIYSEQNQFERAIADYDEAIRLNPHYAGALHNRCWARVALNHASEALSDCNEALGIRSDGETLATRGFVYLRTGAFAKAIADYDAALQKAPKPAGLKLAAALYGRGFAKQKLHDAGANEDIAAAKALIPDIAEQFAHYGIQ